MSQAVRRASPVLKKAKVMVRERLLPIRIPDAMFAATTATATGKRAFGPSVMNANAGGRPKNGYALANPEDNPDPCRQEIDNTHHDEPPDRTQGVGWCLAVGSARILSLCPEPSQR